MKILSVLLILSLIPLGMKAQSLENFRWKNRVLLLFTPQPDDPLFQQQYQLIQQSVEELADRQTVLFLVNPEGYLENSKIFVQRSESELLYDRYSVQPHQFEMVLVGLDGGEKYRAKNVVTPVSVILQLIDEMPMRKRELRQGYGNKSGGGGGD